MANATGRGKMVKWNGNVVEPSEKLLTQTQSSISEEKNRVIIMVSLSKVGSLLRFHSSAEATRTSLVAAALTSAVDSSVVASFAFESASRDFLCFLQASTM